MPCMESRCPFTAMGPECADWLHVDDHCRAIELILTKADAGAVYNVGGGHETSNPGHRGQYLFGDG